MELSQSCACHMTMYDCRVFRWSLLVGAVCGRDGSAKEKSGAKMIGAGHSKASNITELEYE